MKTAHELARELLAGPDLPIWHLDPSRFSETVAGEDASLSEPRVKIEDTTEGQSPETSAAEKAEGYYVGKFITISGDQDD